MMISSHLSGFFLLIPAVLGQVLLPHVSIYMLCNDRDIGFLNLALEMEEFYRTMLPDAHDVIVDGSQHVSEYSSSTNGNMTLIQLVTDGIADIVNVTQDDLQEMVTSRDLQSYFDDICFDMALWEARIQSASKTKTTSNEFIGSDEMASLIQRKTQATNNDPAAGEGGDGGGVIAGVATVGFIAIIIGAIIVCCILSCLCSFCCGCFAVPIP